MVRNILLLALLLSLGSSAALAEYEFLGNVQDVTQDANAVVVRCEDRNELRLEFLLPEMMRVTLIRPGYDEPLLDYPIAKADWEPVNVELDETETAYTFSSSALTIEIQKTPCRIQMRDNHGRMICQDDPGFGIGWDHDEVRCWKTIRDDEKFFGLGLKSGGVNKRGQEWEMWNTDYPAYDNRTDPLYQSIPFFIGIREGQAYGIYLNNSHRTRFNMGAGNRRYYSFAAEGGRFDYFFIHGPKTADVVRRYSELTGKMPLPPLWALGYQQCRWSYYPEAEVRTLSETFRAKEIPADVIYLDIHYMDEYRVFTWDENRFPDPKGLLKDLRNDGFRVVTIIDPGVKVDPEFEVAQSGLAGEHFVTYPDGEVYQGEVWPGSSYFPDFSSPGARAWWGKMIGEWLDYGVGGCWIDMNEPAVWGQSFPTETIFNDEGRIASHKKHHNLYGLLMAKATYEGARAARPDERPFVLTRAGFAGEQRYTAVWTGDNVASWEHLELGIRMVQGLSISGVPFCGMDIGGFIDTPSPELFARWIEVGALSPLCRTHTHHGSADQEPWSFGENVEEISRQHIGRRYQLLPYLYSLFRNAAATGDPIWRPLFWHDQEDDRAYEWYYQHQFFVGEKLLATPVTREGEYFKKIYLPEGRWLEWHTEEIFAGPGEFFVDAPLDRIPLLLREGAIIPSRDPIQYTGEKPIELLTVDVFPSDTESRFEYYEDDGGSFKYEQGKYRLVEWKCSRAGSESFFTQSVLHDGYQSGKRDVELVIHGVEDAPKEILLDGSALTGEEYKYDPERRVAVIRFADRREDWEVIVRE